MKNLRSAYSLFISIMGIVLIGLGLFQIGQENPPLTFFLLVGLGVLSQITMTSFVEGNAGVSVSSAISLTTASLYGPQLAALVAAAAEIGLWLMQNYDKWRNPEQNWRQEGEKLGVNIGMNAIAAVLAGIALQYLTTFFNGNVLLSNTVPWIVGAVVGDQVNLWLLIVIIYLVHGAKPLHVWRENRWAIPINVLVMSAGGGLLASAVREFDLLGIAIFFLPILLSAYSFRLTVSNAKKQMESLEGIVTERTKELATANQKLEKTNRQIEQTNLQLGEANLQLGQANQQLESANEELQTLHMEKNAFLAVLTHDMRTPLTSIKGYASILRSRELEREQQVKISKVILHSQETLLDIVNNILEIEKYQSGSPIVLECESFDLALLTKTAVESIAAPAMEKRIKLFYDEVPDPVMVMADFSKIQRVLLNLISNAVKYTPEEGEVTIKTVANGRYAIFSVRDTGYGIPEDELPTIFDRYSRVKGHQHIAIGTGLGLAIVKSLVEAHQGEISVTSQVDVGSNFIVKLPLENSY
ncbi:MAG: HAMP domain-containing sensor histidine kinase [Chloroflexota bacterium]